MVESSTLTQTEHSAANAADSSAPRGSLLVAALAGLGASVCCLVPFILIVAGVGGASMSYFMKFAPYRPIFIGITLIFLGLAFWRLYMVPRRCETDGVCVDRVTLRKSRRLFGAVTVILVPVLMFPWYFPWLLDVWEGM